MRRFFKTVLVLGGLLLVTGGAGPAAASTTGACPEWRAQRDVREAVARLERAEAALLEARRVRAATHRYTDMYGAAVGRWVRLARRRGFHWHDMAMAMFIIKRESGGNPDAKNPYSTASGLFQFLAFWWEGRFDPFYPPANVGRAARAVNDGGWGPWGY